MKNSLLVFCTICFLFLVQESFSQVKIGDNPAVIDTNSILELESSNKGILIPRVNLIHQDSASPLLSPIKEGTLVYNNGGSISNGFYYWTSSQWQALSDMKSRKENYVLIKSVADFPVAVGGIITLVNTTTYQINGAITISDAINLNGSTIIGDNPRNDQLIYTGSSALITGQKGGLIKSIRMSAASGKVFNLDASSNSSQEVVVQDVEIFSSQEVGLVKGFDTYVLFETVIFSGNTNGITYEDIESLVLQSTYFTENNNGTFERMKGVFGLINKLGGISSTNAGDTAVNIVAVDSIESGAIRDVIFSGSGVRIYDTFTNKWVVGSSGVPFVGDRRANGSLFISTSAETVINTVNVPVKASGTTTAENLNRVTMPTNNRLRYRGNRTRRFTVRASISLTSPINNQIVSIYIAKNGSIINSTQQQLKLEAGDVSSISVSGITRLSRNDFIEVWVENNTSSNNFTLLRMNMSLK